MRDPELLHLANKTLTQAELAAYQLAHKGLSQRAIALALDISRSAVRARLENAIRKLERARREAA